MNLSIDTINRVIAHTINKKTQEFEAYATTTNELLRNSFEDQVVLKSRIVDAINNSRKTFKLEFEDTSEGSVKRMLDDFNNWDDSNFINKSIVLAERLAESHFRTNIPSGYCIIGSGKDNLHRDIFFIIKAEPQEVFNIQENTLHLIKNVFLSPAKDFYKIGLFIRERERFIPYMYDDLFTSQKRDLTEYFYSKFLGLTTDRNDEIKTKNFYNDTKKFVESNISEAKDQDGMLRALNVYMREEDGSISATDFSERYFTNFPAEIKRKFDRIVERDYPLTFSKNMRLLNQNSLSLQRVNINSKLTILSKGYEIDNIFENPTVEQIEPFLNTGMNGVVICLKNAEIIGDND